MRLLISNVLKNDENIQDANFAMGMPFAILGRQGVESYCQRAIDTVRTQVSKKNILENGCVTEKSEKVYSNKKLKSGLFAKLDNLQTTHVIVEMIYFPTESGHH